MSFPRCLTAVSASVVAVVCPQVASATGFRLPDQDAFATARGEAFAATADNASAVYYNPAGITQIQGQQVRGGVYGLNLNVPPQQNLWVRGGSGSFPRAW